MKNIIQKLCLLSALGLAAGDQPSALAQATTQVKPRQYTLLSSQVLTSKQVLNTNAALPGQNIGVFTNTWLAMTGTHPIGLTAIIQTTNILAGASNVVVNVYPAYDSGGGNTSGLGGSYGTNFATVPIFTWTISYTTNSIQMTNLSTALWEPATSLGFTISNGIAANTTFTLIQSVIP